MNKEQLIKQIEELTVYENETRKCYHEMCTRNNLRFGNILPAFKFFEYEKIDTSFNDSYYDIYFKNGPSIQICNDGNIKRFSTSGFSSHDVDEKDLDEIQNYSNDVFTLFSFLRTQKELIKNTIDSFEIFDWEARKTNLYQLQQELSSIEKKERDEEKNPKIGKILTYETVGHRGRTYNTIIKVVDRTEKRFTFVQLFEGKWSNYEETKAINFDKINLLTEKQTNYLKAIGLEDYISRSNAL